MIVRRLRALREWWSTARSSLVTHRGAKWIAFAIWMGAEPFHYIDSIRFLTHASMAFGVYAIWSAEETAKVEVKQEEAESAD